MKNCVSTNSMGSPHNVVNPGHASSVWCRHYRVSPAQAWLNQLANNHALEKGSLRHTPIQPLISCHDTGPRSAYEKLPEAGMLG